MDKLYLLVDLAQVLPKHKVSPAKPALKSSLSKSPSPVTLENLTAQAKQSGAMERSGKEQMSYTGFGQRANTLQPQ